MSEGTHVPVVIVSAVGKGLVIVVVSANGEDIVIIVVSAEWLVIVIVIVIVLASGEDCYYYCNCYCISCWRGCRQVGL